ncbi:hypothetical protein P5673_018923 [Acropora cervicornis]|uniref:DUF5641 domain-containing protein n=1 Tax=Acropora cervicornis TaxID=6130 RepID=A0AAD9QC83_ACRCE|nr:hypothetical protein P5673_018923 [Acropora cervicornis]
MVKDDSLPRNCWQLARVSQANISNDGHVRTVQVTVGDPSLSAKGKRNRPVRLLDRPIQKVKFYKSVGNTSVLSAVGSMDSMCGDALKLLFKYRGKVYLKASQDDTSSRIDQRNATNTGPVQGVEAHSDTVRSEGSQVRVEHEMESSDESEMEVSGESDEGDSSESVGDSDVIEVQLDNAHGGPNRHSDISSDDEGVLLRPVFQSTQVPKPAQQKSKHVSSKTKAPVEEFVNSLYVGTVEEVHDHLLAAETDPESGPAYDIRVLQRLLACNNVPQRLPFLCLSEREMRLQSHEDCSPVLIIHYQPTDKTVAVLRSLMQSAECLKALGDLNIHVALIGSSFADNALGKQGMRDGGAYDVELRIMHPTMTRGRMVVGNIVSGHERNFKEKLIKSAKEACQAATALAAHRNSMPEKKVQQKRLLALSEQAESSKRQRRLPDEGNDGDDSETGFWIVKPPKVRKPVALQPWPVIVEQNHKRCSTNSAPGPGIQRSNRSLEPME